MKACTFAVQIPVSGWSFSDHKLICFNVSIQNSVVHLEKKTNTDREPQALRH